MCLPLIWGVGKLQRNDFRFFEKKLAKSFLKDYIGVAI